MGLEKIGTKFITAWVKAGEKSLLATRPVKVNTAGLTPIFNNVIDCARTCPFGEIRFRLGDNLKKQIVKEMNNDKTKISKFAKIFEMVFHDFHPDTVFEIGAKNQFILYNRKFPQISTEAGNFGVNAQNISNRVLGFCTGALHASEKYLLRQI